MNELPRSLARVLRRSPVTEPTEYPSHQCQELEASSRAYFECMSEWMNALSERLREENPLYRLDNCHSALAAGTNYSRGDDTVLAIYFTRCAQESEDMRRVMIRLPRTETSAQDSPNDPQD